VPINSSSAPNMEVREFVIDDINRDRRAAPAKLLLTLKEASEVLAISRSKLYDLLNSGYLPSVHIGRSRRLRMSDLEKFVMEGGQEY
jgi:excisionase family DNA binding protein